MLSYEEIEYEVYRMYPKDPDERTCETKRQYLNEKRELYRQRLRNDQRTDADNSGPAREAGKAV